MTRHELETIQDFLISHVQTVSFPGTHQEFRYIPTDVINMLSQCPDDGSIAERTVIANDITMDDIISILSDGFADSLAFSAVDYDRDEYLSTKSKMQKNGWKDICVEEVQAQMLIDGKSLILFECETHKQHKLTLTKLMKAIEHMIDKVENENGCTRLHALHLIFDGGDFYDYEGILQLAIFGEVIYG